MAIREQVQPSGWSGKTIWEDTYLLMLREGLPSESFLVLHPLSLCTQDLFHHIASTAITSAQMAHIHTGLTYLGGCICRTTGTSA